MKNKLRTVISIVLVCVALTSLVSCYIEVDPPTPAAYFENLEDAVNALRSKNVTLADVTVDDYAFLGLPEDERFIDVDYIFSSNAGVGGTICDAVVFAVYKLNIEGEDIYILSGFLSGGSNSVAETVRRGQYSKIIYGRIEGFEEIYTAMEPMTTGRYLSPNFVEGFEPEGYITQFIDFRNNDALDFLNENCICFTRQLMTDNGEVLNISSMFWAIYDTRDVPQSEKDALALELMEILYNNYKLAGQKAE